jgi:protocatechuate 3,4-dioxygenase beta subunit
MICLGEIARVPDRLRKSRHYPAPARATAVPDIHVETEATMQNDDLPVGSILTRREALTLLGLSGAALFTGVRGLRASGSTRLPACVARPEQTLGPYFVDEKLNRSDIRGDPATSTLASGALLRIGFHVSRITAPGGCEPLAGAQVDLWQCDAQGIYSDVRDPAVDTTGKKFLRGYQLTDPSGVARFTTIYPGWYRGRTVHVHFKIRTTPSAPAGHEFVSQLYFDDTLTDRVFATEPYAKRGQRTHRNDRDGIFRRGGEQLLLKVVPEPGDGYSADFDIGLRF